LKIRPLTPELEDTPRRWRPMKRRQFKLYLNPILHEAFRVRVFQQFLNS
jgi:hypothetical protein